MIVKVNSLGELSKVSIELKNLIKEYNIFLFEGEMGAGKTTLIKDFLTDILEKNTIINSPTYNIVNEYYDLNGNPVFHFDLYRFKTQEDLENIGFREYLDTKNAVIIIEWPHLAEDFLDRFIKVNISSKGEYRLFEITKK